MKKSLGAALLAAVVSLSACQHAPITPANMMCDFRTIKMSVGVPISRPADLQLRTPSPLAAEIETSLRSHDRLQSGETPRLLSLSGGSEHGAYGAGILAGWGGTGNLPEFQVVTGISTGSILATFAFVGDAEAAVQGYTINSESDLINVYAKPKDGKPDLANYASLLEHGSFGNLEPLRGRLHKFITDDVLATVAARYAAGARLYVGATDADSGDAIAFDLGDMATRYVNAAPDTERGLLKDCYISAIIASSSSPIAAPPAFIDNTMYIDGGTRFGLFSDSVLEAFFRRQNGLTDAYAIEQARLEADGLEPIASLAPVVYAVIDGTLELPPRHCPKKDQSLCTPDKPFGGKDGAHKDWNILDLALNTEHILVNEVYRFSALAVEADACEQAGCFNFLRIEPDVADFEYIYPAPDTGVLMPATCPEWQQIDIEIDDPIEFHKRYMRCLIAYGEAKVKAAGWGVAGQ
ncbi:patatin-like phospholipase family protein [Erythrobacter sp. W53]|uniref:patatin-like phospholipase family protein n=1 Tax=Erythrobacter sp. W53 TaxID=3425947 RepID=UPI003D76A162